MVIVDTDILIDVGRSVPEALTCLSQLAQQETLGVSAVTHMELIVGCQNKAELTALDRFLKRFVPLPLSHPISQLALDLLRQYRLSHGLLIADALLAATVLSLDSSFLSKNQRHYRFIPELRLLPYPAVTP